MGLMGWCASDSEKLIGRASRRCLRKEASIYCKNACALCARKNGNTKEYEEYIKKYEGKKGKKESGNEALPPSPPSELPACKNVKSWCDSDKFRGRAKKACKRNRVKKHCALTCAQMMPEELNCKLPDEDDEDEAETDEDAETDEGATTEGATTEATDAEELPVCRN